MTQPAPLPLRDLDAGKPSITLNEVFGSNLAWLSDYVRATAASIQVSPWLVAPTVLSTASLALTQAVQFQGRPGHVEPPVIWTLTCAAPGERKSSVLREITRPFEYPPSSPRPQDPNEVSAPDTLRNIYEDLAANSYDSPDFPSPYDGHSEDDDLSGDEWKGTRSDRSPQEQARDQAIYDKMVTARSRALLTNDISVAAAVSTLVENHGRLGIFSDEGAFIASVQQKRSANFDVYLQGWSGDAIRHFRKHDSQSISSAQIAVGMIVQPAVVKGLLTNVHLCSRGFPQRFLISVPESLQRGSYAEAQSNPELVRHSWIERITVLNRLPRGQEKIPRVLTLDDNAFKVFTGIADWLEEQRRRSSYQPMLAEWLAKAHGQALRIAGILTLLVDPHATCIGREEVRAATAWIRYFMAHFQHALITHECMDKDVAQAVRVLQWLKAHGRQSATRSEITQALRVKGFDRTEQWTPVFALLEQSGWIEESLTKIEGNQGGRPSKTMIVNQALHEGARF